MAHLLVHHKVEDYKKWKLAFDDHADYRSKHGSKGGKVFRNSSNPNELFVLIEWDNLENAQKFAQSDQTKEVMKDAGVVGMPAIYFVEEATKTSI
jgi:heme-degrading monooxygenase HmoA